MEEDNEKRYFIITFTGLTKEKESQRGKVHMYTDGGCFVNEEFLHKVIKRDFDLTVPYITGIIEMDEDDFKDFTSPESEYTNVEIKDNDFNKIDIDTKESQDTEDEDNIDDFL